MALPVTVESVASGGRDVAIASLHQLLGDRLSTVAPVREHMARMPPIIPVHRRTPSHSRNRPPR
jgi:hypothetical protein